MGKRTRNKSDKSLKNKSTTAPAEKSFEETFENLKFEDPYEVRVFQIHAILQFFAMEQA